MRVVREMNDVRRVDTDSRTDLARKNPDIIIDYFTVWVESVFGREKWILPNRMQLMAPTPNDHK